jgi:hypothetical protein
MRFGSRSRCLLSWLKIFLFFLCFSKYLPREHLDVATTNNVYFHILSHLNCNYVYCFQISRLRVCMYVCMYVSQPHFLLLPSLSALTWSSNRACGLLFYVLDFFILKLTVTFISIGIVFFFKGKNKLLLLLYTIVVDLNLIFSIPLCLG